MFLGGWGCSSVPEWFAQHQHQPTPLTAAHLDSLASVFRPWKAGTQPSVDPWDEGHVTLNLEFFICRTENIIFNSGQRAQHAHVHARTHTWIFVLNKDNILHVREFQYFVSLLMCKFCYIKHDNDLAYTRWPSSDSQNITVPSWSPAHIYKGWLEHSMGSTIFLISVHSSISSGTQNHVCWDRA